MSLAPRDVLEHVLAEYDADLLFVGKYPLARSAVDEYRYYSHRYGYSRSVVYTFPTSMKEFERQVRSDLEAPLR